MASIYVCFSTGVWFNTPLSSSRCKLGKLAMSDSTSDMCVGSGMCLVECVCVLKVHNAAIIIYRLDTPPSLVWDHLKLPFPSQSHSQHHHPVYLLSTLLALVESLEVPIRISDNV